jgi:hypothetical protein
LSDETPYGRGHNVVPIRSPRAIGERAPEGEAPLGSKAAADERFVYDVVSRDHGYAVTFEGKALTRHATPEGAIANARLIAGNMWEMGRPSLVRLVGEDGAHLIASFG